MSDLKIIVRTADQTRKAEITVPSTNMGKDIIDAAVSNWSLPTDTDYSIVNITKGVAIIPTETLEKSGVQENDMLEVQPVLVAGK